jgi:hypothetical protein
MIFTTFSIAGCLYLMGVGIVLFMKPSYMFTPDGDWKEFGIGQNEDRYTPFPFWLFCLSWALVAYFLVVLMEPIIFGPTPEAAAAAAAAAAAYSNSIRNVRGNSRMNRYSDDSDSDAEGAVELPKGYYVLNKKATRLSGVPKYVYLGPQEPQE